MKKNKNNNRIFRIQADILRILSEILVYGLKDPRVGALVSVSKVELTGDLSYATVYVSGQQDSEDLLEGLNSAKGFLRKKLSEQMTTFRIPELIFKYDNSAEVLQRIDQLLEEVGKKGVNTNTLEEIGNIIRSDSYQTIAVMPHIFADGDAIGSCTAMCRALEQLGKKAVFVIREEIAKNLSFLTEGLLISDGEGEHFDLVISLDTGSVHQIRDRREIFENAPRTVSIDHHKTNDGFADIVYVDVRASATAEILYDLFLKMRLSITPSMAEGLFTAISTDTGSFKHSNTTSRAMFVASELLKTGFDFQNLTNHVYKSVSHIRSQLLQTAIKNLVLDDVYALSHAFDGPETANSADYEGITDYILSLEGVEVASFARRLSETEIKFSLRSKSDIDVSAVAESMGGGGHVKAAGFVTKLSYDEAAAAILKELKSQHE